MEVSEILEPLHNCVRELIDIERQNKQNALTYTDDDVMAAALMFSHVMGNRLVATLTEEKVGIGFAQDISEHYAAMTRELVRAMSGLDTVNYYKNKKGKNEPSK